jgi:hypothetical protein
LIGTTQKAIDTNNDGKPDQWEERDGGRLISIKADRDFNGTIDYIVSFNDNGEKKLEEIDFNYDGNMDDYYFYSNGVLKRREIDSNYDQKVDIWVYLTKGIYVTKFERDTDFDGEIDLIRDYDK